MKSALQIFCLMAFSLLLSACSDSDSCCDGTENSCCEPVGWVCVSILDQHDQPMSCDYSYNFPASANGYENHEQCAEGQLLIHGNPGSFRVNAECGQLTGHVQVPLEEGDNGVFASRLVGSLCYNDLRDDRRPIVLDPRHKEVQLGDYLGYSTHTRCTDWFGYHETYWTEIVDIQMVCVDNDESCDPMDGRDYLAIKGEFGIVSNGWPIHLTVEANTDLVAPGQEVTLMVSVREMKAPEQGLDLPVVIQGPEEGPAAD